MDRVKNGIESTFLSQMEDGRRQGRPVERVLFRATGNPDYFAKDLARYQALQPSDIQAAVRRWLPADKRLELSVVPEAAKKEEK